MGRVLSQMGRKKIGGLGFCSHQVGRNFYKINLPKCWKALQEFTIIQGLKAHKKMINYQQRHNQILTIIAKLSAIKQIHSGNIYMKNQYKTYHFLIKISQIQWINFLEQLKIYVVKHQINKIIKILKIISQQQSIYQNNTKQKQAAKYEIFLQILLPEVLTFTIKMMNLFIFFLQYFFAYSFIIINLNKLRSISMQPLLLLKVKLNENSAKILVQCEKEEEYICLPSHPLFQHSQKIILKNNKTNKECLKLLAKGKIELPYKQCDQVIKRCRDNFKVDVRVDVHSFAMTTITSTDQNAIFNILDTLDYHVALKIFKKAYETLGQKLHLKVTRKLKNYADNTKRPAEQKQQILSIYQLYKQALDEQQAYKKQQVQTQSTKIQTQHIIQQPTKTQKYQRQRNWNNNNNYNNSSQNQNQNRNNYQNRNYQNRNTDRNTNAGQRNNNWNQNREKNNNWNRADNSGSKGRRPRSKERQLEAKIILGINGDSQAGWRERMRPNRIPPKKKQEQKIPIEKQQNMIKDTKPIQIKSSAKPQPSIQQKIQKPQISVNTQQKIDQNPSNLKAIFKFPKEGKKFDFKILKKYKQFSMFINNSFWINWKDNTLLIFKEKKNAFIRPSEIDIVQNGFLAQGVTINLDGMSNIEDGGQTKGNPVLSEFTGSDSQWFEIKQMIIQVPKSE